MFLIVFLLVAGVSAQDKNPCPDILTYSPLVEGSNRYNAVLNVQAPQDLNGVWIHVNLDKKADVLFNDFAETTSANNKNFIIRKGDATIPYGDPVTIKLTVKFGDKNSIPNVDRIKINGFLVCPRRNNLPPPPPKKPLDIDIRNPETNTPKLPPRNKDEICGTVPQAVGLIYNGREADEGAWPWHVAIMKIVPPFVDYICGGSIISKKIILTAAHCVTVARTKVVVDLHTFLIYFGLTKLSHISASAKTSTMSNIIIPEDYNAERLFNDIALIQLPYNLEFTDFIRPVCLWSGDIDQSAIVGKQGALSVGGVQENEASSSNTKAIIEETTPTTEPKNSKISPVVENETDITKRLSNSQLQRLLLLKQLKVLRMQEEQLMRQLNEADNNNSTTDHQS